MRYTDSEIISHLHELKRREGHVSVWLLQEHEDLISPTTAVERFGSWTEVRQKAGLSPDGRTSDSNPRRYTDQDLLDMFAECKEEYGKVTTAIFTSNSEFAHPETIRKRFGSWPEAKRRAGVECERTTRYSERELLKMIYRCEQRHGDCTILRFRLDDDFCAPETVMRRFDSWRKAKARARRLDLDSEFESEGSK